MNSRLGARFDPRNASSTIFYFIQKMDLDLGTATWRSKTSWILHFQFSKMNSKNKTKASERQYGFQRGGVSWYSWRLAGARMLRRYISRRICGAGSWFISLIWVIMLWTDVDKITLPLMLERSVADSSRWRCSSALASSVIVFLMATNKMKQNFVVNKLKHERNFCYHKVHIINIIFFNAFSSVSLY